MATVLLGLFLYILWQKSLESHEVACIGMISYVTIHALQMLDALCPLNLVGRDLFSRTPQLRLFTLGKCRSQYEDTSWREWNLFWGIHRCLWRGKWWCLIVELSIFLWHWSIDWTWQKVVIVIRRTALFILACVWESAMKRIKWYKTERAMLHNRLSSIEENCPSILAKAKRINQGTIRKRSRAQCCTTDLITIAKMMRRQAASWSTSKEEEVRLERKVLLFEHAIIEPVDMMMYEWYSPLSGQLLAQLLAGRRSVV